ncbi:MAG: endo-1,4-beta-xylanase [Candidatus Brocadiia bacterium]
MAHGSAPSRREFLAAAAAGLVAAGHGAAAPEETTLAAIREHRMGTLAVRARPGAEVRITQLAHQFRFGTAISWRMFQSPEQPDSKAYLEVLESNFNAAVHENALKWYHTGRKPHAADYSDPDRMTDWCLAHGIRVRGHCLFWAVERYVQDWVKALSDAELREAVRRRAEGVVAHFRGRIAEYDVNNEMMHGRYFRERLGEGIAVDMFRWAQAADPEAVLYVNDYGVLHSGGEAYARHIQGLLDRGAPVGGIGIQGHLGGGGVDPARVRATLDTLARFRLPIVITEFDLNTRDQAAKARGLEALYRTCFAHPAVDGILMWGFWEGRHWRPDAALWTRKWEPTLAAKRYRRLVFQEWWTRFQGRADAHGRCAARAFYGRHRVEADGRAAEVELARQAGRAEVDLAT